MHECNILESQVIVAREYQQAIHIGNVPNDTYDESVFVFVNGNRMKPLLPGSDQPYDYYVDYDRHELRPCYQTEEEKWEGLREEIKKTMENEEEWHQENNTIMIVFRHPLKEKDIVQIDLCKFT